MAHELWLELSAEFGAKVHHRDVVGLALRRMKQDLCSEERSEIFSEIESAIPLLKGEGGPHQRAR
jgi:hypothetical protein